MCWLLSFQHSFLIRKENATSVLLTIGGTDEYTMSRTASRLISVLEPGTSPVWVTYAGTRRMLPLAHEHLLDSYCALLALADEA